MTLLPPHADMLAAAGISSTVIETRGYRSVETKAELKRLGFADSQCRVPTLLIPVHNTAGRVVLHQHRPDAPRQGKNGKPIKYETPHGEALAVDVPPAARQKVRDPAAPLFITEGVKKADSAVSRSLCCVALLGVEGWRGTNEHGGKTSLPDWADIALNARQVYVVFDSDIMLKKEVYQALVRFSAFLTQRGARVAYVYLPSGDGGAKVGLDDFFAAGNGVDDLLRLASPDLHSPADEAETRKEPPAAQRLVEIGSACELFHNDRDENFARFEVNGHRETRPVRSSGFKEWLSRAFYTATGRPAPAQAVEDALRTLEGRARYDGGLRPLTIRMAHAGGSVWLDLADAQWRAVEITPEGWALVAAPPCLFRRYAVASAQCLPTPGGNLDRLRDFLNVRDEDAWWQLVAWLIAAFLPDIGHPVLVVHGEQGSAKSTLMRLLAALVDPSKTPLRSEPRDLGEWVQAADHSWLTCLDNVSHLPGWLSDAICRAVTGEGFAKRQLYTDAEDVIISFRRVVALTGIEVVAQRADLLDRAILLPLDSIAPERRRSETEVLAAFEAERPAILGALLDVLAAVLKELPRVQMPFLPRMADFARVGVAVERVLYWPPGTFLAAYNSNIREQHEEALSSSSIGDALRLFMAERTEWTGTASDLLSDLGALIGDAAARRRDWPKSPKSLGGQIRRVAPNLRAVGVTVEHTTPHGQRLITLTRTAPREGGGNTVPCVPAFQVFSDTGDSGTQEGGAGTQTAPGGTQTEDLSPSGRSARNARNANQQSVSAEATDADLIAYRKAMYSPDKDGTFWFETWHENAAEVRSATRDRDEAIRRHIQRRRAERRG